MKIMSWDPGGTTGLVILDPKQATRFHSYQLNKPEHHTIIWSLLHAHSPEVCVYESFDYRVMTDDDQSYNRSGIELISRNYIGVMELYDQLYGSKRNWQFIEQKPAYAVGKNPFFTDEKLKRMGIYVEGAPHANDAMRHLLMYLCFKRKIKKYLKYIKPNRSEDLPSLEVEYNSVG